MRAWAVGVEAGFEGLIVGGGDSNLVGPWIVRCCDSAGKGVSDGEAGDDKEGGTHLSQYVLGGTSFLDEEVLGIVQVEGIEKAVRLQQDGDF